MEQRRRYSAEDKVRILQEHLDNGVKISDLSEKYNVHPNVLRRWKKDLFEGALATFSGKHKSRNPRHSKEQQLQAKVSKMQEVITELSSENLELKKKYFGAI